MNMEMLAIGWWGSSLYDSTFVAPVEEPNFSYHLPVAAPHPWGPHSPYFCYSGPYPHHTHGQDPQMEPQGKEEEPPC